MTDFETVVRRLVRAFERDAQRRAELEVLEAVWKGSPNYGIGALAEALDLCADNGLSLPPWLARAVRIELRRRVPKQTLLHYRRWREVRRMRDMRPVTPVKTGRSPGPGLPPAREISYEQTFRWVAELLGKTPAASSPKAIKRSYALVEKDLPEAQRYKRTYAKLTR